MSMNAPILHCMQKLAYACAAGVNPSAVELGRSRHNSRRTCASQHTREKALFLCLSFLRCAMAGYVGTPSGVHRPRAVSANPAYSVTNPFLAESGDSSDNTLGTITMHLPLLRLKSALSPSVISRAKAHRAMALAALRSDSSLKSRLSRYNAHIAKARQLENVGGAKL